MENNNFKQGQIVDFTYRGESVQVEIKFIGTMSIIGILQHEISLFGIIWQRGEVKYFPLDEIDDLLVIQDVEKEEKCRGE